MSKTVQVTPCQDTTAQVIAALNQVRSENGLPPLATPAQAELDTMKKELEHTKEELKETKQIFEHTKEAFKTAIFTLKDEYDRLDAEKDRLQSKNEELEEHNKTIQKQIDELQKQIDELTAVPAPASPNRPAKLQKWIFCQYLLQVDPSKKIYNTFRNKWIGVMMAAQRIGGGFLEDADALNHQSIESLDGMIDILKDIYERYRHDEIKAALNYLIKAKEEFPNA